MQVIQNQSIVDIDWLVIEADQSVPESGNIIVPFAEFIADPNNFMKRGEGVGVLIPADVSVDELADYVSDLSLIALEISKYPDGRLFSQARLLRDKYAFTGEILALGDMLRDQVPDLIRCGVSMVAFTDSRDINDALAAFKEYSVHYQPPAKDGKIIGVLA